MMLICPNQKSNKLNAMKIMCTYICLLPLHYESTGVGQSINVINENNNDDDNNNNNNNILLIEALGMDNEECQNTFDLQGLFLGLCCCVRLYQFSRPKNYSLQNVVCKDSYSTYVNTNTGWT